MHSCVTVHGESTDTAPILIEVKNDDLMLRNDFIRVMINCQYCLGVSLIITHSLRARGYLTGVPLETDVS